jgi:EAL domain-containing protein (putative c-di-GMP-specific phosphodiesterase class I)
MPPGLPPAELRAALTGAMIEPRYQPIVRLADRAPVGLEALARLNHPTRGRMLPDRFVPQMEDAGLALLLTQRIANRAFADMLGVLAPHALNVALNFPLDVLLVPDALALLDDQRRLASIAAERVVIELTESRPVHDIPALARAIEWLRQVGYGIAIDDLSPAVPRLDALLNLPFSSLKLDKTVVLALDEPEAQAFVSRLVAIAAARGMTMTAEGVESAAIWHRLHALGVDHAQGFLVARATQVEDVPAWLTRWAKRRPFRLAA